MIKNRIEKNWKKLKPWSQQSGIEAFRIYDRDIPEFQVIVDYYQGYFVIYDKTNSFIDKDKNIQALTVQALQDLFQIPEDKMIWKSRERQSGLNQYEKLAETKKTLVVKEGPAKFIVNLWDYLDTGLFLDHRPIRQKFFKTLEGKSLLNLFCYTGSVSVSAALGGAKTTSVDMSTSYLEWAESNFKENSIPMKGHEFLRADILAWLKDSSSEKKYDAIFLDPPTFSNSKKMQDSFEVERDQIFLIPSVMKRLAAHGALFFSNNKRSFRLDPSISNEFSVRDISSLTIPRDFHDQKIHQCYEIRWKK